MVNVTLPSVRARWVNDEGAGQGSHHESALRIVGLSGGRIRPRALSLILQDGGQRSAEQGTHCVPAREDDALTV